MKTISLIFLFVLCFFASFSQKKTDLEVYRIYEPELDDENVVTYKVTVKNSGKTITPEVKLKIFDADFKSDKNLKKLLPRDLDYIYFEETKDNDADPYFEFFADIPSLKPGEEYTAIIKNKYWPYDPNCELGVFVDCENKVAEKNEKNNFSYFFNGG